MPSRPKSPLARTAAALLVLLAAAAARPGLAADSTLETHFDLGGSIYLFEYLPQLEGAREKFEIYAFVLNLDGATEDGRYGLHVQTRARDSKLRSYFVSDVWFQEAYVWAKTPVGDLHVGKVYRKVGLFWDDSFFGNVQYFNGLKLNPDYGAELVGSRPAGEGFHLDYSAQYFVNNDKVAGSLPGRDVESDDTAELRNTVTGRVAPTWSFGPGRSLAIGLSGLSGRIARHDVAAESFDLRQMAGDATLTLGPWIGYAEVLDQSGEPADAAHPHSRLGYDDSTYYLVGTRWRPIAPLQLRLNWSQVAYDGAAATETEILPGVTYSLRDNLNLILEYDYWKTEPDHGPETFIDKSWSFVVNYVF